MLSHELRNPLAAILNANEMAARVGAGTTEARNWLGVIGRRARHMTRLVDDLLDVARFTQSKIEIRKYAMDLGATIADVIEEVRPWFDETGLVLTQEGPGEPLPVSGDPVRLQQVQVNLLRNAAKYTPDGGRVWYSMKHEGDLAVIRVRDTGVGLSAEMLGKVFEPFVQADETLDRAGGGIGVGLTLVRSIVELHQGTVEVLSAGPGTGSEFIVSLPLLNKSYSRLDDANQESESARFPRAAVAVQPALKLLVVEDDLDIRASLVGILKMDGHNVQDATDGSTALDILTRETFDVALLDIGLPGIDGYELARQIKAKPGSVPYLIALTGYGRPEDRAAAAAAGFDFHLTKPFRPDDLIRVLTGIRQPVANHPHNTVTN
jgi:CheY-like chemotaxis protein